MILLAFDLPKTRLTFTDFYEIFKKLVTHDEKLLKNV